MKFTNFEKDISHVSKLPDVPTLENGYTPDALKKTFDRAGEEIQEFINESLIPELEKDVGAESITVNTLESVSGKNVQEVLENIAEQVQDIANGAIPDGTVTAEKFVEPVAKFITEGSLRSLLLTDAGSHTFVPTRTGNYKISVQGAGGGGDAYGIWGSPYGGGSGAFCIGWVNLTSGQEYRVVVGAGGKGLTIDENGACISYAEEGGDSGFYDGENEILFAEGGKTRNQKNGPAVSRGGLICKNGAFPRHSENDSNDSSEFAFGGSSFFGEGAISSSDIAGIGAGGFGANYYAAGGYYSRKGTDGGNGAVLIEWVE